MKQPSTAWYHNRTWTSEIDSRFEKQLRYTRNPIYKAECLQVQGCILLENRDEKIQEVGQHLLSRLFEDHPTEYCSVLTAQEKLGDYFFRKKDYEKAAEYFKIVMDYCVEQQSRTNTSMMTDLKWASTMLQKNQVDQFEQAYELVTKYPVALLKTPGQKFYHAELGALLCERMYKKTEAVEYARVALKQAASIKPAAGKDKTAEVEMDLRLQKLSRIVEEPQTPGS